MKLRLLGVFVLLASLVSFVHAEIDPMNLPSLTQYVTDFAGVLSSDQQISLESLAQSYDKQTSNQIVAVLIPHRQGNEIFDIGMDIFKNNKIGQAGKNNGLLLVISTEEKKIRIVVGYGLEGEIPDLLASRIIEDSVRPLVNQGDFAGAIRAFYDRSMSAISTGEGDQYTDTGSSDPDILLITLGLVIGILVYSLAKSKTKKSWRKYIIIGLLIALFVFVFWLSVLVFYGFIVGLFFFAGGWSGGSSGGWSGGGGWGGGGGSGFDGGGGDSGGGGAGD